MKEEYRRVAMNAQKDQEEINRLAHHVMDANQEIEGAMVNKEATEAKGAEPMEIECAVEEWENK